MTCWCCFLDDPRRSLNRLGRGFETDRGVLSNGLLKSLSNVSC